MLKSEMKAPIISFCALTIPTLVNCKEIGNQTWLIFYTFGIPLTYKNMEMSKKVTKSRNSK